MRHKWFAADAYFLASMPVWNLATAPIILANYEIERIYNALPDSEERMKNFDVKKLIDSHVNIIVQLLYEGYIPYSIVPRTDGDEEDDVEDWQVCFYKRNLINALNDLGPEYLISGFDEFTWLANKFPQEFDFRFHFYDEVKEELLSRIMRENAEKRHNRDKEKHKKLLDYLFVYLSGGCTCTKRQAEERIFKTKYRGDKNYLKRETGYGLLSLSRLISKTLKDIESDPKLRTGLNRHENTDDFLSAEIPPCPKHSTPST